MLNLNRDNNLSTSVIQMEGASTSPAKCKTFSKIRELNTSEQPAYAPAQLHGQVSHVREPNATR